MPEDYDLRKSVEALGKLTPVLKDAHGNVIDGLHRLELYPDWPCVTVNFIDTPEKLEAARLAVNTNRRIVSTSEMAMRVEFLLKSGLTVGQISGLTGLSERTVYKYKPQELKDLGKVHEKSVSAEAVHQTVKTPDTLKFTECERCHINTTEPKTWHGHTLCTQCEEKANLNPEAYKGFFHYAKKQVVEPKAEVREYKPTETWEQRNAVMSPQHSKMEMNVIASLIESGVTGFVQDRHFCVLETIPDIYLPAQNLAIYLDFSETHEGNRLDKDEKLRELLVKRHGVKLLSIPYDSNSKSAVEEIVKTILEVIPK